MFRCNLRSGHAFFWQDFQTDFIKMVENLYWQMLWLKQFYKNCVWNGFLENINMITDQHWQIYTSVFSGRKVGLGNFYCEGKWTA